MKILTPIYNFPILSAMLIVLFSGWSSGYAQDYSIGKQWYIGPHIGAVSFFGDLSVHDYNPGQKLTEESGPGYGIMAGKGITRYLDVQLSWTKGKMKGSNPGLDMKFNNSFSEISLGPEIIVSELIWPGHISRLNFTVSMAAGVIQYRSIKYRISDGAYISSEGLTPRHENSGSARTSMVIPVGIGLNYRLNYHWTLRTDFDLRLQNKDLLDAHIGSTGISDRYVYSSIGIVYVFAPADKPGIRALECPGDYRPEKKRNSRKNRRFSF